MKTALIFLNGYYDTDQLDFYRKEIEIAVKNNYTLICADGGIRLFDLLNHDERNPIIPDILIGDMDSIAGSQSEAKQIIKEWIGQTDKDMTDGQLAVKFALDTSNCCRILLYGGLPNPGGYETDHFIGNLKLMPFGQFHVKGKHKNYIAEMRDPHQTIHYLLSALHLNRKNKGLQRVSLIADKPNVVVESSKNLRWDLTSLHIHPDLSNALRNEFVEDAEQVEIRLTKNSAPVYVIHNWSG